MQRAEHAEIDCPGEVRCPRCVWKMPASAPLKIACLLCDGTRAVPGALAVEYSLTAKILDVDVGVMRLAHGLSRVPGDVAEGDMFNQHRPQSRARVCAEL